jgi:pimeloyl-ACP methyl ester carboxylesterase
MGGKIAQVAAAMRPQELSALALLTPGPLASSPPVDVSERIASYGDDAKTRAMITGWRHTPLSVADETLVVEDGLRVGRHAWNGWLETMRNEDFSSLAPRSRCRRWLSGPRKTRNVPKRSCRSWSCRRFRGRSTRVCRWSDNLPHLEDPVTLGALLINFWTACRKASPNE